MAPLWLRTGEDGRVWAQVAVETIPSLLGFSIGGMAITLAFSNSQIFNAVIQGGKKDSLFVKTIANFFHFILVQTIALLAAILCKSYSSNILSFFGFWVFCYGILAALVASGMLLQTARVFNVAGAIKPKNVEKEE
ncbi:MULTISPECIES: hypothetical protein [unclassified Brucella]|uniref:hypothetical protein n=1 Tax=unclassified Brucella TaxID=2632610 RepID=UPI0012AD71E9|nr:MULTISPECIES: hypothetical protein [unclassified Brucella]MRN44932.1 hypothetical protein [Brucella sp. 09RB8913]MRN58739.1 hypothetical protein [Brucella sp. 09RB8918]